MSSAGSHRQHETAPLTRTQLKAMKKSMTSVVGKPILSREDLISAGANFCTQFRKHIEPLALSGKGSFVPQAPLVYENQYLVEIGYVAATIHASRGLHYFDTELGHADLRHQLAIALRDYDPAASEALLVPWPPPPEVGWPRPEWANANGLKLDALLFVATQRKDADAIRMYIAAGADPLTPTFEGDCAARLGTARGMLDVFDRPDWLNAKDKVGNTGLFRLARIRETMLVEKAVWMGGDLEVQNNRGHTVLDALDDHCEKESCARIRGTVAEYRASVLQNGTGQATRSTIGSARNRL